MVGNLQASDEAIAQANPMATELRQPLCLWYVHVFQALRALMQGQWEEGERLAEIAHRIGQRVQPDGADVYWAERRFMIRWKEERLAEMEAIFTEVGMILSIIGRTYAR